MVSKDSALQKLEQERLIAITKAMTFDEQQSMAMGLRTEVLNQELHRRETLALNLVDSVTEVIRTYLNEPADLEHSESLIKELRKTLRVKDE